MDYPLFKFPLARLDLRERREAIKVDRVHELTGRHEQIEIDDGRDVFGPVDRSEVAKEQQQSDMGRQGTIGRRQSRLRRCIATQRQNGTDSNSVTPLGLTCSIGTESSNQSTTRRKGSQQNNAKGRTWIRPDAREFPKAREDGTEGEDAERLEHECENGGPLGAGDDPSAPRAPPVSKPAATDRGEHRHASKEDHQVRWSWS